MNTTLPFAFGLSLCTLAACHRSAPTTDTTTPQEIAVPDEVEDCSVEETCAWSRGRIERTAVLVLEEVGGWGGDAYPQTGTPTFALYDDGLVLFVEGTGAAARVRQAVLPAAEVDAIVRAAHDKLDGLPETIVANTASDQPLVVIRVATRGPTRTVSATGIDREGKPTAAGATIPSAFAELYAALRSFRAADAQPWSPDEIAIRLHRHRGDASSAAPWPTAVPLPPDDATEPAPTGKPAYPLPLQYRVDGALEAEVLDALAGLGEPPIVQWRGEAWIVRVGRVVPG